MKYLLDDYLTVRFLFVFFFSIILIKILIKVAFFLKLVDKPNKRKIHSSVTPLVGGLVIYLAVVISVFFLSNLDIDVYYYLVLVGVLIIAGVFDDKYDISPSIRLLIEFGVAGAMICTGVYIQNLGDLFGQGNITLPMTIITPLTVLAVVAYINALNMIDGLDGVAASLSIIKILTLIIFLQGNYHIYIALLVSLLAAILAFLAYNLQLIRGLHKVFLGDAGTMFLGFTFAWLVIRFSQGDQYIAAQFSPVTALYILGFPLVDMLATIGRRIKKGKNPLKPDRTHVHHILLNAGFTSRQTLAIIIVVSSLFNILGISLHYVKVPDGIQLLIFLSIFGLYYEAVIHAFRLNQIINFCRGDRNLFRKCKLFTGYCHGKNKLREHGMVEHMTHQPEEKHALKNRTI